MKQADQEMAAALLRLRRTLEGGLTEPAQRQQAVRLIDGAAVYMAQSVLLQGLALRYNVGFRPGQEPVRFFVYVVAGIRADPAQGFWMAAYEGNSSMRYAPLFNEPVAQPRKLATRLHEELGRCGFHFVSQWVTPQTRFERDSVRHTADGSVYFIVRDSVAVLGPYDKVCGRATCEMNGGEQRKPLFFAAVPRENSAQKRERRVSPNPLRPTDWRVDVFFIESGLPRAWRRLVPLADAPVPVRWSRQAGVEDLFAPAASQYSLRIGGMLSSRYLGV